jgi:SAM-dependent MidA family methyltransferase
LGVVSLSDRLAGLIDSDGPISVAHYMAQANAHYYATRDPFGAEGDFVTAPEISQMFGELAGLWLADLWARAGKPGEPHYIELGPGRGTLAADALRAMRAAGLEPRVDLVETSPVLRRAQAERLPGSTWHDSLDSLPPSGPALVIANEFFDALPIRQLVATQTGWRERLVVHEDGRFRPVAGPAMSDAAIPVPLRAAPPGSVIETSPSAAAIAGALAARIAGLGGAALIVDYGHEQTSTGETLQAVAKHLFADPWTDPGERDLTAHVDFEMLGEAARRDGVRVYGPRHQGEWLQAMGLDLRAEALARSSPERADELKAARDRLASPDRMGKLFKVMALVAPAWPEPAGFG